MTVVLRGVAVAIAVAAFVDPTLAVQTRKPLAVELILPAASDPEYAQAQALARRLEADLADVATLSSDEPKDVRVVLGNGVLPADLSVPVYAIRAPTEGARAVITDVQVEGEAVPGQSVVLAAEIRGIGLGGRTSMIALLDRGVPIAQTEQAWTSNDERLVTRLPYVPARAGVHPLTVLVSTPGITADARAATAAVAADRPLRVLLYEPRPSWPVAFVRRLLERDPAFTVAALSRSGRGIATRVGVAPRTIEVLDANAFDVLVVGAPDALTASELDSLDRFVSQRGGALVLVPDRRLTTAVESRFALPAMEELLLEKPVPVRAGATTVHASELLLPRERDPESGGYTVVASLAATSAARAAVVSVARGEGTVVTSGLLDAWRHRGLQESGADEFWRGLIADLAVTAPRRLHVRVDPAVAQPGDRVSLTVSWRRDAIVHSGQISVPPTTASITNAAGVREMIRLWPGGRSGVLEASITASAAGHHTITASANGETADAIFRVEGQVVRARRDQAAAAAFAAAASGGAVVADVEELLRRLRGIDAAPVTAAAHPMRSPWWILPFTGCLCAEWFLRRRRGLR